jgi:hypothetical protein
MTRLWAYGRLNQRTLFSEESTGSIVREMRTGKNAENADTVIYVMSVLLRAHTGRDSTRLGSHSSRSTSQFRGTAKTKSPSRTKLLQRNITEIHLNCGFCMTSISGDGVVGYHASLTHLRSWVRFPVPVLSFCTMLQIFFLEPCLTIGIRGQSDNLSLLFTHFLRQNFKEERACV